MHGSSLVRILAGGAVALASFGALAVVEVEPNDTLATAQYVSSGSAAFVISGERTFADPTDDFFSFDVGAGGLLSIVSSSPDFGADSIMGLFGPGGTLLASNDDGAGSGSMSALEYFIPSGATGRYTLGFSGYNPGLLSCTDTVTECYDISGDFIFDNFVAGGGSGGSTGWTYTLDVSGVALVPEPRALALFALGVPLLVALRQRRRSLRPRA